MSGNSKRVKPGRPRGAKNKLTLLAAEKLEAKGCCPITALAEIGQEARDSGQNALAATCYKELAKYVHPQLKAVEHSGKDGAAFVMEVNMVGVDVEQE